ncbi:iron ABC transporter permease [Butyrivibrio sp.]|uniref:FecCD family ABC transporter permease n=1 Tax=Butyrivibrio sp. TaxID=28121 RepID=UPI0025C19D9C|nr:iron ABC transporter permease [Butyrivibrio sp.]MBQ9305482.1 iron ABC transporter permease [Butyrivibrio sp.]
MKKITRELVILLAGILALAVGVLIAVLNGSMDIGINDIANALFRYSGSLEDMLIRDVRLPRAIAAVMVGGSLGLSGALMQGVTRNPIAEPSLLGISQGATLVVAVFYALGKSATLFGTLGASLAGALVTGLVVIFFALYNPSNMSVPRLLLAGTALSTFLISITNIIGLLSNQSQMIGFWIAGGFRNAGWSEAVLAMVVGFIALVIAIIFSPKINIVSLGDDVATGLGANPKKVRFSALLLMIPLCAMTVAVGRTIGFVGLVVPQIVRLTLGEDYRKIIPYSFLLGSVLCVFSDILARTIYDPYEIPVGIFTSLLGVPFFLYMAGRSKG